MIHESKLMSMSSWHYLSIILCNYDTNNTERVYPGYRNLSSYLRQNEHQDNAWNEGASEMTLSPWSRCKDMFICIWLMPRLPYRLLGLGAATPQIEDHIENPVCLQ